MITNCITLHQTRDQQKKQAIICQRMALKKKRKTHTEQQAPFKKVPK